jgi:uncharacterized protein YbjT (DUF2867 family)
MDVAVVGGHGQVALRLLKLLAARGDRARGVIRKPEHVADLEAVGAEASIVDLENDDAEVLASAIEGADAVVFAAGAGPGSGPERKQTVDLGGALKLIDACKSKSIGRYVIVSSIGAHQPPPGDESFAVYLRAKHDADQALVESGLDHSVVRPGSLSDDPGSGGIDASTELGRRGKISRDDVAATLAATLDEPNTIGKTFEIFEGETEIAEALKSL